MSPDLAQNLDELLDRSLRDRLKEFADELAAGVREECAVALASATEQAREQGLEQGRAEAVAAGGSAIDSLAECARRIRQASAVTEIAAALVESAALYTGRAALFIHRGDRALGFRASGALSDDTRLEFQKLSIPLSEAAGLSQVIETLETRETNGASDQLGEAVTTLLGLSADDRAWLIPVALRDKVLAVLYLDAKGPDGEPRPVQAAAIEVLVALTEAWIEAVGNRKKLVAA